MTTDLYQAKISNTIIDTSEKVPISKKETVKKKGGAVKAKNTAKLKGVSSKTLKGEAATKTATRSKNGAKKPSAAKTEASTTTKTTKRKAKKDKILHWSIASDLALIELDSGKEPLQVRFKVHGNPLPLRRHRTSRGFMYNPSAGAQASFGNVTQQIILNCNTSSSLPVPLFPPDKPVVMSILFRMKRPNTHFVGNKPGPDRLRDNAPSETSITRTDVDNLAKFVLDSLNGILYEDDRQVCSLHVTKILDNDCDCQGSTEISCWPLKESHLSVLMENSFDPLTKKGQDYYL